MPDARNKEALLHQNLLDAGCGPSLTEDCMRRFGDGQLKDMLPALAAHRKSIVQTIRKQQKQLDCLDYLTNQIKKEHLP